MLRDAYGKCRDLLKNGGIEAADFEARCLVEHVTGYSRAALITHGSDEISEENEKLLYSLAEKRLERIPLQYILGSWSFCGFEFEVGEGVLIPRDDTEVVVNLCLDFLKEKPNARVIDLCAGSGAISVALEKLGGASVTAVELSDKAFNFLNKNIAKNKTEVKALKGDIFKCYESFKDESFDLIVSNPPYIKRGELDTLQEEVRHEPMAALDGGESGFDFYEAIIKNWSGKIKRGGALAFELGEGQVEYVERVMKDRGFGNIRVELDFGGTQRAIIGTML